MVFKHLLTLFSNYYVSSLIFYFCKRRGYIDPDELTLVSNLCEDYTSFSLSSMSINKKLVKGRPHGGISIMWRKSISNDINIVQYDDNRFLGLKIKKTTISLYYFYVFICHTNVVHFMMIIVLT